MQTFLLLLVQRELFPEALALLPEVVTLLPEALKLSIRLRELHPKLHITLDLLAKLIVEVYPLPEESFMGSMVISDDETLTEE